MSAKQFVEIIRFFAQNILGDRIVIQDNNVDDVKRFVDLMEYPHQMNKSWFKAPTVSIAYDRNVEFLDWLCDFVSISGGGGVSDDVYDVENNVTESTALMDQQFMASFVADVKKGFMVWSDRNDEFDEWKSKWIRKLITTRTGMDDIDASIDRLQNEYKSLQSMDTTFGNEMLLQTQQKKCDELGEAVAKMKAVVDEKTVDYQETSNELYHLSAKNEEFLATVNKLKLTIKNQKFSADDRTRITSDLLQKQHLRNEKRAFIASLKSIANDNQVKIGRLQRQKTTKVFAINNLVQKLFQIGINFDDIGLTINQLSMHECDTKDQIKTKLQLFGQIKEIVGKRRADLHASMNDIQQTLTSISNELFNIEDEASVHKKHLHSLEIQLQKIENQIADTTYESEQKQQQLQEMIDNVLEKCAEIEGKIRNAEKNAESLNEENQNIMQGIELKANSLLQAKLERQALREAALSELEKVCEQLKNAATHRISIEPFFTE